MTTAMNQVKSNKVSFAFFKGKEMDMWDAWFIVTLHPVIFAGPLNLSQSSEEYKIVPKTKDASKIKGSSKSRVVMQDNRGAPPPLPDVPTGMACDRCISFAFVSLFYSFIPSLKMHVLAFQLRP